MASNETAKMENSKISLDVFAPSHCAILPKIDRVMEKHVLNNSTEFRKDWIMHANLGSF